MGDLEIRSQEEPNSADMEFRLNNQVQEIGELIDYLSYVLKQLRIAKESRANNVAATVIQRIEDITGVEEAARIAKEKFEEFQTENLVNSQRLRCEKGIDVNPLTSKTCDLKKKFKEMMSEVQVMDTFLEIEKHYGEVEKMRLNLLRSRLEQVLNDVAVLVGDDQESCTAQLPDANQESCTAQLPDANQEETLTCGQQIGFAIFGVFLTIIFILNTISAYKRLSWW